MRMASASLAMAWIILTVSVTPRPAAAAWPPLGRALTTAPGEQGPAGICSDGAGGAIVAWLDTGSDPVRVFAQHVLASGETDPAWPLDGRALTPTTKTPATTLVDRGLAVIVPDGAGGAIVAWQASFTDSTRSDIFAQHVLASGAVDGAWPENGIPVCTLGFEVLPDMVSDGAGGAIITWVDARSDIDIFAQHVLAVGILDPNWPVDGRAVTTAPGAQVFPAIVSDGAGGAIITWHDFRDVFNTGLDIYAQHVLASGVVDRAWPLNGRALCVEAHDQFNPTVISDGAGGAIVAWDDRRELAVHPFAQHVLASGQVDPAWPTDGLSVSRGDADEVFPRLAPDGTGGAIVAWQSLTLNSTTHAQHVLASGVVDGAWPVNGRAMSSAGSDQIGAAIAPDGAGGAFVAWQDTVGVFTQHVLASGALDPAFSAELGRPLSSVPGLQAAAAMVADGAGGAIVAWTDFRDAGTGDIYAMQVLEPGPVGVDGMAEPRGVSFSLPVPNPVRGTLTLRFALERAARHDLSIYDASGRRVRRLSAGARDAGQHAIAWDLLDAAGRSVGAGLYFARLEVEGRVLTRQIVALR